MLFQAQFHTPLGPMTGISSSCELLALRFCPPDGFDDLFHEKRITDADAPILKMTGDWLNDYFARPATPPRAALPPIGFCGTDFQTKVWSALMEIPYGSLTSYGDLAEALSSGARAVANAVSRNPVLIMIPCHRVIKKDRTLGGFSAGPGKKLALLSQEGVSEQLSL